MIKADLRSELEVKDAELRGLREVLLLHQIVFHFAIYRIIICSNWIDSRQFWGNCKINAGQIAEKVFLLLFLHQRILLINDMRMNNVTVVVTEFQDFLMSD